MVEDKSQEDADGAIFPNAISIEDLKQHDSSVSFTCERIPDVQVPGSAGLLQRLKDWLFGKGGGQ